MNVHIPTAHTRFATSRSIASTRMAARSTGTISHTPSDSTARDRSFLTARGRESVGDSRTPPCVSARPLAIADPRTSEQDHGLTYPDLGLHGGRPYARMDRSHRSTRADAEERGRISGATPTPSTRRHV